MCQSSVSSSSPQNNEESIQNLITNQKLLLCNLPIIILVVVAALDNADKQLLAASFPMLEEALHLDVQTLGYFSLYTNLSYAISLPFWGYLVHKYGMDKIHIVLSLSCTSWGIATIGIAISGSSILFQGIFRTLNGIALGSILPLSQTLLIELIPSNMKGRAFGFMGISERLAGMIGATSIIYLDTWQTPYYCLGFFSVGIALIAFFQLHPSNRLKYEQNIHNQLEDNENNNETSTTTTLNFRQIIIRICKIPTFIYVVLQGVFGNTPWDMMSFMLLLLDWRGFTKEQIVLIQLTSGISAMISVWMGGTIGDYAYQRFGNMGRVGVGFVSVVGGIPLYGLFLYATNFYMALVWINLFHLWAVWCDSAALRPICVDITHNPSERAQIISMWNVLEKASGAIFGAPLVGYLTNTMVPNSEMEETTGAAASLEKTKALALSLFVLSSIFWGISAIFWILMGYSLNKESHINTIVEPEDSNIEPLLEHDIA